MVLVPTRVGYGVSGGPDVENSGRCNSRDFATVAATAAEQTVAILKTARKLPYVDLRRGLVVGQSFGGMTTIALAARGLPGLVGAINFAGGAGGNPREHPEKPCSAERLAALYRSYGEVAQVPTLWLYSENDRYWGKQLPRQWFRGFVEAGGKGRFVQLPAYQDNGHGIFSGNPGAWRPAFERFLAELGF